MPRLSESARRIRRALAGIVGDVEDIGSSVSTAAHRYPEPEVVQGPTDPLHPDIQYEHSDISARGVVITGYSVLAGVGAAAVILYFVFSAFAHHRAVVSPAPLAIEAHGNPVPPEPRLQESPLRDLADQRVYERSVLNKYWWVDRQKGVVGMPIERAMQMIAQRGIPSQKAPEDLKLFPPHTGDRGVGFEDKVAPEPR